MISRTLAKLRDPEYRKAFVSSQMNVGIPFQIRALLKSRGWTQENLAERTGMRQPRISALLTPGKVRPNIETLRRIAEAFDCGLEVRFVSFSELVQWSERFDPEHFNIPTFEEEIRQAEERENALVAALSIPTEWASVTIEGEAYFGEPFRASDPQDWRLTPSSFDVITVPSRAAGVCEGTQRIPSEEFKAEQRAA